MKNDEYMKSLDTCNISLIQVFESFHRTEINLVEDDVRLVLDECKSSSVTYERSSGIKTFIDLSEALYGILQPESPRFNNSIDIEYDDFTMNFSWL